MSQSGDSKENPWAGFVRGHFTNTEFRAFGISCCSPPLAPRLRGARWRETSRSARVLVLGSWFLVLGSSLRRIAEAQREMRGPQREPADTPACETEFRSQ